jgi:adenylate cyclase
MAGHAPEVFGDGSFSRRELTILFADLRGFTEIAATFPAAVVMSMLNRWLVKMSEIIAQHNGAIDKFMGDAIMVLFSRSPTARGDEVRDALSCAVNMQIAMHELNATKALGVPDLYMGIGLNTGSAMAGLVGSELYSAYTVIGEDVNLASRIEALSLRGQVLISEATHELCQEFVGAGAPMDVYVKGRAELVRIREVLAIPSAQLVLPRREMRRSPRVKVELPFTYQVMRGKAVMPEQSHGVIEDIGYHGVLIGLDHLIAPHSEIKLAFELSLLGRRVSEVYAKVVKVSGKDGACLAGVEFSSLSGESEATIRRFVQMLVQTQNAPRA